MTMNRTDAAQLRVRADDPAYIRDALAEADFWATPHPLGLESLEQQNEPGIADRYTNLRFTGDEHVPWQDVICRYGDFRRALVLGTSSLTIEGGFIETNPRAHVLIVDISEGALERRRKKLGPRFPTRVDTAVWDLNFATLTPNTYDVIVSCGTLHHVANLEYMAGQINSALTDDGFFFLQDYVGEPRFAFSAAKRHLFEKIHDRAIARQRGRKPGVIWADASDLSPFCGVRSDELLPVLRDNLNEIEVRTVGTLIVPLMRTRPADGGFVRHATLGWRLLEAASWRLHRVPPLAWKPRRPFPRTFFDELAFIGDALTDEGLLTPANAFAIYRKR